MNKKTMQQTIDSTGALLKIAETADEAALGRMVIEFEKRRREESSPDMAARFGFFAVNFRKIYARRFPEGKPIRTE